jgi:hypothetical protein
MGFGKPFGTIQVKEQHPEALGDGVKDYVPKVRAMKPWSSENQDYVPKVWVNKARGSGKPFGTIQAKEQHPEGLCDGVKDYVPKVRAMRPCGSENPSGRFMHETPLAINTQTIHPLAVWTRP